MPMPTAPRAMTPGIDHISHGSRVRDDAAFPPSLRGRGVGLAEPASGDADPDAEAEAAPEGDADDDADGDGDGDGDGGGDGGGDGAVTTGGRMRCTTKAGRAICCTTEWAPSLLSRIREPGPTEMPSP